MAQDNNGVRMQFKGVLISRYVSDKGASYYEVRCGDGSAVNFKDGSGQLASVDLLVPYQFDGLFKVMRFGKNTALTYVVGTVKPA